MRWLGTLKSQQEAEELAALLKEEGIAYQAEVRRNNDWGNEEYGTFFWEFWIWEEDDVEKAKNLFAEYKQRERPSPFPFPFSQQVIPPTPTKTREIPLRNQVMGPITRLLLGICIGLFLLSHVFFPSPTEKASVPLPYLAIFASPVQSALLYDFPEAYAKLEQFVEEYGATSLASPEQLPRAVQGELQRILSIPFWQGAYTKALETQSLAFWRWKIAAPLFEKIRQGEYWRIVTPAFLHADLLHLLFNMLWLVVLGKQIEARIGPFRTLLFVLIAASVSNTAQYLMSGANFLGFSGVLCAMLTYIWIRLRSAPWEGYLLPEVTIGLLLLFIGVMFLIQLISFVTEFFQFARFSPGIANTAHLSGAFVGILLGKIPYFSWKAQPRSNPNDPT